MDELRAIDTRGAGADHADGSSTPLQGQLGAGEASSADGVPADRVAILKDRALDERLRRDGFAVVDLLGQEQVDALRKVWEILAASHPPVWDPTGMAATIRHPGLDLLAHARAHEIVEVPVGTLSASRTCFMSTFLAKQPRSDVLPAHLDWRLVEEPDELTHGCWIALQDMHDEVGALGVVPGSHHLVDFDRTPEEPGHGWTTALIDSGVPQVTLPLRAGQAIVFDHRLVHYSTANGSNSIRLALNLGLSSPQSGDAARELLLDMMHRGMRGIGSDPQIPELLDPDLGDEGSASGSAAESGRRSEDHPTSERPATEATREPSDRPPRLTITDRLRRLLRKAGRP